MATRATVRLEVDIAQRPVAISGTGESSSVQVVTGRGCVRRLSLTESTGSADATVDVYDGRDNSGVFLERVTLIDNESTRDHYGWNEYPITSGLYFDLVSGSVDYGVTWQPEV